MMKRKLERQVCVLLPNKQHLDCTVRVKARGQEVLNHVQELLQITELQVFGLAVLRDNEYLFVDLAQKLSKYFGKEWSRGSAMVPFILFLRVQYYIDSGRLILSSRVLQLYYTELRQKVLRSQSRHQETLFFQLAASALQAEVGDLELRQENKAEGGQTRCKGPLIHYFLPEDYFPPWLIKRRGRDYLLQHCPQLHSELRGMSHRHAILEFIKQAGTLQDGPVTLYSMKQEKKEMKSSILLGVAVKGVHIYQEVEGKRCLRYELCWTDVDRLTFQGSRFEVYAVASLCLPKLVFYNRSTFHSKHVLRHLTDCHRFHMNIRDAVRYIQQLEDMHANRFYKEAYICDMMLLKQKLHCNSLESSMSDCSVEVETTTAWSKEKEEEEEEEEEQPEGDGFITEAELCLEEPAEVLVDNLAEVSWLAELVYGVSVDGPLVLPSSQWTAVTMEMKQVLRRRSDDGVCVD
ncbi:FERM domain-containing protein 6-like [Sphaeramia orbicularis]|uniref:FERM domain-containing protein 6-like n=1 Tax=Sphaeramia orbicularis TaxID=375764 RepID=UPI00117D728F|nr:FERM domain-containing protein 6-like [Sphaeramia orbicularis]